MNPVYVYLHGFASGPQSAKAVYLKERFQEQGLALQILDLNQGDFSALTLTRQIQQVRAALPAPPQSAVLIGSSLGGLTAAWVAETSPQVKSVLLLAPAFQFLERWLQTLGAAKMRQWQTQGYLEFYHYGEKRSLPLGYCFVEDIAQYQDQQLQRSVPTLILHGVHDQVVPIAASRDFAAQRPWVKLMELESDHSLGHAKAEIWQALQSLF